MAKLRFVGDQVYQGHDKGKFFRVLPGGIVTVSDERAEKLKADYPGQWKDAGSEQAEEAVKPQQKMPAPANRAAKAKVRK